MTVIEFVAAVAATAVGTLVQGTVGIGLTLVAGPALIAIDSDFAPAPLLIGGIAINVRHFLIERSHADFGDVRRLFIGVPFGLAAGLVVLSVVDERLLAVIIGMSVLIAALALLKGLQPRGSPAMLSIGGAVTALTATTAALPGPPFALIYSDRPGPTFRGTSGAFLSPLVLLAFIALIASGHYGSHELQLTATLLPGVTLGLFCARFARPFVDRRWFRPAVLIVSAAGGIALVVRNI